VLYLENFEFMRQFGRWLAGLFLPKLGVVICAYWLLALVFLVHLSFIIRRELLNL
jgi:hypothetical protein